MTVYEKIKLECFRSCLDEPFQILELFSTVRSYLNLKNENEVYTQTIAVVKYLLETNLFDVGDLDGLYNFTAWNLTVKETLLKIKSMIETDEDLYWKVFFKLTAHGEKEANEYLNKLNTIREKVLLLCENNYINIQTIISIVKEVFETNDSEEIEYEFLESISSLADWFFIETGIINNNEFQTWGRLYLTSLKNKINANEPEKEFLSKTDIYFRITKKGKLVLDEWRKHGGRIADYFDKIKFLRIDQEDWE